MEKVEATPKQKQFIATAVVVTLGFLAGAIILGAVAFSIQMIKIIADVT